MISHPQAHTSATISQFLGLVRVGMLLRHVSVAPFPLALSVAAYNRLAKTGPELRTCLYVCDVDGLAGSVVGSRNLHLGTRETLSLFLVVQLIDHLIGAIEQHIFAAYAHAPVGTILGALALVHHGSMSAEQCALLIHDFAGIRLGLLSCQAYC